MTSLSRRVVLKAAAAGAVALAPFWGSGRSRARPRGAAGPVLGLEPDGASHVYLARGGRPGENVGRLIDLLGGVEALVGPRDIVLIKPNSQWWNQGMSNTDALKAFIDAVLARPGFSGEVLIADNHQFAEDDSRGWTTEERNGSFNYNELVGHYHGHGCANVNKVHWRVAGRTALPLEGDAQGNGRVAGPGQGDGYVWLETDPYVSPAGRSCLMTYPVFTSPFSGISVDLKNGPWRDGGYLDDRRVRFINFSALNHHSFYCGVTASVKNLMGVVDMSCGFPGNEPQGTFNTHHIGVSRLIRWKKNRLFLRLVTRLGLREAFFEYCYRNFHHTGGSLGWFMRQVRLPDLNVITAELTGWGSRTDRSKAAHTAAVAAGRDPVALDYIAARDILLGATPDGERHPHGETYRRLNDPDNQAGPFHRFLRETAAQGIGSLDPGRIRVHLADSGEA